MLNPPNTPQPAPITVLYDGACPLCRREIALYQGLPSNTSICYVDVSHPGAALPANVTQGELLARFHVQDGAGQLRSGAAAFLLLWAALPGWRWLARFGRLPGATWAMERAYRFFLRWRPLLQRAAGWWDRPNSNN
jgi:predicted DCC family thiol-disulfide oxidoreductase YuxK